jgi:fructosamine-3-kinase
MQRFFAASVMFVVMNEDDWRVFAEQDMGVSLGQWRRLSGGDFAQSWQATVMSVLTPEQRGESSKEAIRLAVSASEKHRLDIGSKVFIKTHQQPPPRHFTTEARGLVWLSESATVRVPAVLGVSDENPYLALHWVEQGRTGSQTEAQFGCELAQLHRSPCSQFGRVDKRSTGSLGLPNEPCEVWADFYATQRLLPLVKIAHDRQALNAGIRADIESLAQRLPELVPVDEKPCRLHGDLWAGNRLVDVRGHSWVIDPASHGGHREFDLAMMRLFGGFSEDCHSAYAESLPLSAGWQGRIALHQLAPLIVHAIKFGQSYVEPTRNALAQYI